MEDGERSEALGKYVTTHMNFNGWITLKVKNILFSSNPTLFNMWVDSEHIKTAKITHFLLQGFGFFHKFQVKLTQTTGIPNFYQVYQVDI